MRTSYLDYAMSVIIGRAIPDVRDGLKPVHRRILYAMHELKPRPDAAPYKKCATRRRRRARQVPPARRRQRLRRAGAPGARLLDALPAHRRPGQLRLGRRRSARPPTATPRRASRASRSSSSPTSTRRRVDFGPELRRLASTSRRSCRRAFPNLLVNGSGGIAVGMATNIPPHNLGEIIDATIHLIRNPTATDRRADALRPRARLPDRRPHLRPRAASSRRSAPAAARIVMRARIDVEKIAGQAATASRSSSPRSRTR